MRDTTVSSAHLIPAKIQISEPFGFYFRRNELNAVVLASITAIRASRSAESKWLDWAVAWPGHLR